MANYIRFDWAMKRLLRNKANFGVLEGLLTTLLDEKITGRTMYALELQGFKCPQNKSVRKTQEFKAEYQRQLTKFRQEQAAEKEAKRVARQAERQEPAAEESAQ